jgi:hypothetical protein
MQPALNYLSMDEAMLHCTADWDLAVGSGTPMADRAPWATIPSAAGQGWVRSVNDLAFLRTWNAARAGPRPGVRRWARE